MVPGVPGEVAARLVDPDSSFAKENVQKTVYIWKNKKTAVILIYVQDNVRKRNLNHIISLSM